MEGQTIHWPKEKGQTPIYKTLHRKLKIGQHEPGHFLWNCLYQARKVSGHLCVCIDYASFYNFSIGFWNRFDNVVFYVFH